LSAEFARYSTKFVDYWENLMPVMPRQPLKFSYLSYSMLLLTMLVNSAHAQTPLEDASAHQLQQLDVKSLSRTQASAQDLQQIPGATNLVDANQLKQGRIATNADVLAYQAGVYAKSPGNEGTKISIRGSGINRSAGAHGSGLQILLDDLFLTGPGGTPYELQEPFWVDHAEIYRGANGSAKGALALGGAINYLSKTGKDAAKLELNYQAGSHGYQKYSLSTGQDLGQYDYYLSLTGSKFDGYQAHSSGDSKGIMGNVGWQISPNIDTRFYIRYRETYHDTPGALTKQQLKQQPRSANAFNQNYDAFRKQPGSTWLANMTTIQLQQGATLRLGLAYHDYPMDLQESLYRTQINYHDLSSNLEYTRPYQLLGLESTAKIGFRSTAHLPNTYGKESLRFNSDVIEHYYGNSARYAQDFPAQSLARKYHLQGADHILSLSNDLQFSPQWALYTELSAINSYRGYEVSYPETQDKYSQNDWHLAPRLGLRYQFRPEIQFYGNISRSIEPVHPWALGWSGSQYFGASDGAASGRPKGYAALKNQSANSIEIGSRGQSGLGQWDLSYYHSWVRNEFLQDVLPGSGYIVEYNASPTIHQGLELSLHTPLWESDRKGKITLAQSYTFNDFHYDNDPRFGSNQLAAIPKHFYQAELRYSHPSGLYATINTEYSAKRYTDYANSFYADSYQLWGASLGYIAAHERWQGWLNFRNIGNKHYAEIINPGYNDKGLDNARSIPGEGFGTYVGLTWRYH
jgi:iron complex outermembrane receptor protein